MRANLPTPLARHCARNVLKDTVLQVPPKRAHPAPLAGIKVTTIAPRMVVCRALKDTRKLRHNPSRVNNAPSDGLHLESLLPRAIHGIPASEAWASTAALLKKMVGAITALMDGSNPKRMRPHNAKKGGKRLLLFPYRQLWLRVRLKMTRVPVAAAATVLPQRRTTNLHREQCPWKSLQVWALVLSARYRWHSSFY